LRGEEGEDRWDAEGRRLPGIHARLLALARHAGRGTRVASGRCARRWQGGARAVERGVPRLPAGAFPRSERHQHEFAKGLALLLDRKGAQRVIEQTLAEAKRLKGAEAEVTLSVTRAANTRFARSEITSTGDSDDTTLDIHVAYGKRHASVTVNQLDQLSLRQAVARAAALARIAPEDPE